ncbi:cell division protein FtsZ [Candidatus Uhrbacteria bacterium CG_4_10_14_0_8_um_filter_58_22]|uniref:Cell division protein FtsZ n=1 Tax=Candidatus Uhrbacteria bacterium CG_4_10_14_0_8_um_filter_58_22 TaxID=1975029 RepID=A0A2M7QA46_9BACT|nr:MAG: cell division protein FtsZ [Parcubacteria group bacterium CG1_02_58_44]PIY62761.1 MAG: cell division protein FtsZ [Candidatus Uhrbacteria bacterium CG_4_10_14_0_8_um_filter_58_22]
MAEVKPAIESFAKIKVIGVGGSGGSAINRMIRSKIKGVEFIVANTDVQALHNSVAPKKIQLGKSVTRGLGAGMNPDIGKQSAEENQNEIREALNGADMVFITCGLGGGTGSGASPTIAEIARDCGALTVAVVTRPFSFEGVQRKKIAERAFDSLVAQVDTIIAIPNDRVLSVIDKKTSLVDAFEAVDDVLRQGVQSISEIITVPGLVNVDFADVKAIMQNTGSALMGIGVATGENRVITAAKQAISSPLLEMSIEGAKGILFTITGGVDLSMHEFDEASKVITGKADPEARVIFGAVIDESLKDEVKVCVIATGFDADRSSKLKGDKEANPFSSERFGSSQEKASERLSVVRRSPTVENLSEEKEDAETSTEGVGFGGPSNGLGAFVRRPVRDAEDENETGRQPAVAVGGEEDLEIPAFIRRKMP